MLARFLAFAVAAIAVYVGMAVTNPGVVSKSNLTVVPTSDRVERLLSPYKEVIGDDYPGYRGHIYRVLSYSLKNINDPKQRKFYEPLIETALVYHDIALWTVNELDYLEPSYQEFRNKHMSKERTDFTLEEDQIIRDIIIYHHKVTPYEGPHAVAVNAVLEGDWTDATRGIVRRGNITGNDVAKAYSVHPPQGFYEALASSIPRISGWNIPKGLFELSQIIYF
eukprot:Clim_evm3s82 gene=Clim_evmTU3s82